MMRLWDFDRARVIPSESFDINYNGFQFALALLDFSRMIMSNWASIPAAKLQRRREIHRNHSKWENRETGIQLCSEDDMPRRNALTKCDGACQLSLGIWSWALRAYTGLRQV